MPYRPVRQAHRRRRLSRRSRISALAWSIAVVALSIGTALGGGSTPPAGPSFQPVALLEHAADVAGQLPAGASSSSDGAEADGAAFLAAAEPAGRACAARLELAPATVPVAAAAATPAPAPARTTAGTQPLAAFLGDSYTTGYNGLGIGAAGWPAIVARALGVGVLNRAVAGTGFVNPGWTGQPIRTQVDSVVASNPRLVFLAGGHNDRSYGATAAMQAAGPVIDRLASALPRAILVVVGPIWSNGSAPASLVSLDTQLRSKAGQIGATYLDPIRAGWFAGAAQSLISGDGIHPTDAGHRHIADLVLAGLRADRDAAARLTPAVTPPPPKPAPTPTFIAEPIASTACPI